MNKFKQRILDKKVAEELSIKGGVVTVDVSACDGCGSCVSVCPQSAINIDILSEEMIKKLPFKGRLKVWLKGKYKASINASECTSCGNCIKQCHEFAIHKVTVN